MKRHKLLQISAQQNWFPSASYLQLQQSSTVRAGINTNAGWQPSLNPSKDHTQFLICNASDVETLQNSKNLIYFASVLPAVIGLLVKGKVAASGTPRRTVYIPICYGSLPNLYLWCGGRRASERITLARMKEYRNSYLSSILVLDFSQRSSSCGRCASSSQELPQPSTRARSFPVPRGSTAIWHCF